MKTHRTEIVISIIFVSVPLIFIIIFGGIHLFNQEKERNLSYLLFNPDNLWKIDGDNITDVLDEQERNKLLQSKSFDIYSQKRFVSSSSVVLRNAFWRLSESINSIIKEPMVGYSGQGNIEVASFESTSLTENDLAILNQYTQAKGYTISSVDSLTFQEKVVFDFDQDGRDETFYIASNLYDENEKNNYFQIILYYDDIYKQVIRNDFIPIMYERKGDMTAYEFFSIIKLPNESNYDIVLNRYRSMGGLNYCPTLYRLKDSRFEMIKTCKEMES